MRRLASLLLALLATLLAVAATAAPPAAQAAPALMTAGTLTLTGAGYGPAPPPPLTKATVTGATNRRLLSFGGALMTSGHFTMMAASSGNFAR